MEQQEAKQEAQLVGEAEEARQREAQLAEATAQARLACLLLHTPCALLVHCLCTACALLVHGLCTACARLVHCIPSSAAQRANAAAPLLRPPLRVRPRI